MKVDSKGVLSVKGMYPYANTLWTTTKTKGEGWVQKQRWVLHITCRINTNDSSGVWIRLTPVASGLSLVHRMPPGSGCGQYSSCTSHHTPPPPEGTGLSGYFGISIIFHTIYNNYLYTRVGKFLLFLAGFRPASLPSHGGVGTMRWSCD